ncbi:MAG: CBS domain-containing protein [Eubacteriales bacterium]|jgi:CBS domain-containing protein|nr:CBS domain-containing protein [Eubacteriales bacterium]NCC81849.1 CBS domain-containing protein [Clostridia bacterium]
MLVKDIMSKDVVTVYETNTIEEVARIFIDKKISGVPVVDSQKKIVGIISEGDLVFQQKKLNPPVFLSFFDGVIQVGKSAFFDEIKKISAFLVKDLMTKDDLIIARETADLSDVASLLIENKVNRIPIVDDENRVVGIVTRYDIIKANYEKNKED